MKKLIEILLPDLLRAFILSVWFNGPRYKKFKNLWLLEDGDLKLYIPVLRRYTVYAKGFNKRLSHMLKRYELGNINDALILDVGAHLGEFAIAASPHAKQIICFEPDPVVREALLLNIASLDNVKVLPVALSNQTGVSNFYVATKFADSSLFKPTGVKSQEIQVDTMRLDDLNIDFTGYSRVVLKMDAEGFEPEVVEGGLQVFSKLDQVAIDVSPERGEEDTYADVKKALASTGLVEKKLSSNMVLVSHRPPS